ncbi:MAG: hypothetical protein WC694_03290 [Candidatus Paceibacterota bacterium]|jgi:hypothetical protein
MESSNPFPRGENRKEINEYLKEQRDKFKSRGKGNEGHYDFTDSALDNIGDYGEEKPFLETFMYVIPDSTLQRYIEKTLEVRKGKAIGVEFGGTGSKLFSDFSPGFFAKSVAISLADHRSEHNLKEKIERDKRINHQLLIGDIFSPDTYKSLDKILDGEKVDLIIERMIKGLEFVPPDPYIVSKILNIWYNLLREGGVMFIQTPPIFNNLLETWVKKIRKEFEGKIEIKYKLGADYNCTINSSAFRLNKLKGAPNKLPLLDTQTVKNTNEYF